MTYDAGADVLYISRRDDVAVRGREDRFGIVWRYDREGKLIGATVVDFHERWADKSNELATELSRRFDIPKPQATVVVERALELGDN